MRKSLFLVVAISLLSGTANAQGTHPREGGSPDGNGSALLGAGSNPNAHDVDGHVDSNGTSVAPHMQTKPNGAQLDNYGTRGNIDPHTGEVGTR